MKNKSGKEKQISRRGMIPILGSSLLIPFLGFGNSNNDDLLVSEENEEYRDVRFLTPVPDKSDKDIRAMPFSEVSKITGQTFFWAKTIKVPYLDRDEAINLVTELNNYLKS